MFRFQLLSDIHLEFMLPTPIPTISNSDPKIQQEFQEAIKKDELLFTFFNTDASSATAPYLALVGDIGLAGSDPDFFGLQLQPFIKICCSKYKEVFYVAGNHEYYNSNFKQVNGNLSKLDDEIPNFHFLNRTAFDLELSPSSFVRILGTTLWSKCDPNARKGLSDFRTLKKFGVDEMWEMHDGDVAWLQSELTKAEQESIPCVALTHHVPLCGGLAIPNDEKEIEIEQNYKITGTQLIPQVFDARDKFAKSLKAWCWGHSHHNLRNHVLVLDGVKCMTNQYGYPDDPYKKLPDYQKCEIGKVFEVDVSNK